MRILCNRTTAFITIGTFFLMYGAPQPPLIISIRGSTHTIQDVNSCKNEQWANKANDACACCLIQSHTEFGATKSADEIVTLCKDAQLCTEQSIAALKTAKKVSTSNDLLKALSDDVVISPMTFDTSLLTSNGQFTEQSLPTFLYQAYQEQKLPYVEFSKPDCLKVKNIASKGGYNTLQLFLVISTCSSAPASLYIVKESKDGIAEATALHIIEHEPSFKGIIAPEVKPGLPSLSLPLAYFAYPDKQIVHYISAMPSAKGKVMADWVLQYQKEKTPQNAEILKRAFFILGKETANFHKLTMKPAQGRILGTMVAHGDFHLLNLFFDEIGGHFTFIDNETIARYIKTPANPAKDICKPFYIPFNNTYDQFKEMISGIHLGEWYDLTLKNFVLGYISQFPKNQQKQVLQELKTMFDQFEIQPWVNFYDQDQVLSDFINPMFDELEKGLLPSPRLSAKK